MKIRYAADRFYLFAFGPVEETPYSPGKEYGCAAVISQNNDDFAKWVELWEGRGFGCFIHRGPVAGRDSWPVNASGDLQLALARSGWKHPYLPTEEDREFARGAGYNC